MCGLIGYISDKPIGQREGHLHRLMRETSIRGADGWGYAAYVPRVGVRLFKNAESVKKAPLEQEMRVSEANVLIGHVRAATSGTDTSYDCHPLREKDVFVVHNGMISNDNVLRDEFKISNSAPQVDSYLIAWLIAQETDILSGIRAVFTHLEGSLTFLVFSTRSPYTLWAASNSGNLHHFKVWGRDYLASTPMIFLDSLEESNSWFQAEFPSYKISRPLKGVYELSPWRVTRILKETEIRQLEQIPKKLEKVSHRVMDFRGVNFEDYWSNLHGENKTKEGSDKGIPVSNAPHSTMSKRERKAIRKLLEGGGGVVSIIRPPSTKCETCTNPLAHVEYDGVKLCWECARLYSGQVAHTRLNLSSKEVL